jgi:hypothetical protein
MRNDSAQQPELSQIDPASGTIVLSTRGASLYRTYVGRASILDGSLIDVYINDALVNTNGATGHNRT